MRVARTRAIRTRASIESMKNEWIVAPKQTDALTGEERFVGCDARVLDFWSYAMSDLRMNNVRGYLAEFLVAKAVGATALRVEWDAYDVLSPDGLKIEVKSAAYLQAWDQRRPSRISFSGLRGRTWTPQEGESAEATYNADIYVFALHTAEDHETYSALNLSQWTFWVLTRAVIAARGLASISLQTLRALAGDSVSFEDLASAISGSSA
jgi:hypothetical protein